MTHIATGWTENRSVPNKARKWAIAALEEISKIMPFPIVGIVPTTAASSSTTTCCTGANSGRSPSPGPGPATPTTAPHVEQKNWAVVRTVVGYHRYDTAAELLLLNKVWVLQSQLTN